MTVPNATSNHPVAVQLREKGVTRAAIVDDLYDTPNADNIDVNVEGFVEKLERREDLREALAKLGLEVKDPEDVNDAVVAAVWERRDESDATGELAGILLGNRLGDWQALEGLRELLGALGLDVACLGCDVDLPEKAFGIVFLDYYYGGANDAEAVQAAKDKASQFFDLADEQGNRPLIVLMSSKPDAEGRKEAFREASGLLKGLFGFLPKSQLREQEELLVRLGTWATSLKHRHVVQRFAEALCRSAREAIESFDQKVRALSFADYANIQWLSLRPDGHPLGDYMLWLYKAVLAHLLHEHSGVLEEQAELDKLRFSEYCPSTDVPSDELADIYSKALTIPGVGPVGPHPLAPNDSEEPYLRMGDLFVRRAGPGSSDGNTDEVLLLISPACDLMYSPGAERSILATQSLFFLPGHTQPIADARKATHEPCLEFLRLGDRAVRVVWESERVCAVRYGKARRWLGKMRFERLARLSLPYVLELQHDFAASMARVGPPVAAPLQLPADVQVYCQDADGNITPAGDPVRSGALLVQYTVGRRTKRELRLTPVCLLEIRTRLKIADELITKSEGVLKCRLTELGAGAKKRADRWLGGLPAKREKLKSMMELSRVWLPLLTEPLPCPEPGKCTQVSGRPVCVYFDSVPEDGQNLSLPAVLCVKVPSFDYEAFAADDAESRTSLGPEPGVPG